MDIYPSTYTADEYHGGPNPEAPIKLSFTTLTNMIIILQFRFVIYLCVCIPAEVQTSEEAVSDLAITPSRPLDSTTITRLTKLYPSAAQNSYIPCRKHVVSSSRRR